MAIVQNPIIGRARKQAGRMIFSKWRGLDTMRSNPLTVANPKTEKQRIQRNKLSTLSFLGRIMRPIYVLGFREVQGIPTTWNLFVSNNISTATYADADNVNYVNTEALKVSDGSLSPVILTGGSASTATATVSYDPNQATASDEPSDLVSILVIKRELPGTIITSFQDYVDKLDFAIGGTSGVDTRADGTVNIDFTNLFVNTGDTVDCYIITSSTNTDKVSISQHIEITVL